MTVHNPWLRALLTAAALGTATVGGVACGPPYGEVIVTAPPPERVEVVGVAPYPGAIWVRGHWRWNGATHIWIGGHWERQRVGYVWEHSHWVRYGNGWRFVEGHWRR